MLDSLPGPDATKIAESIIGARVDLDQKKLQLSGVFVPDMMPCNMQRVGQ